MAFLKSDRGSLWVIIGAGSKRPEVRNLDDVYHVEKILLPVIPKSLIFLKITSLVRSMASGFSGRPKRDILPAGLSISNPWWIAAGFPDISATTSTPIPPVISKTSLTTPPDKGFMMWVAPIFFARSSLYSLISVAIILVAPPAFATPTDRRPTGPHPRIAMVFPAISSIRTVSTAFPRGSCRAAISGGRE